MNLTEEEIATLEACKTEDEWNAACDAVKRARGGSYPDDWWSKMMLTGRAAMIAASFPPVTP
jgi:hypothetical protein